MDKGNVVLMHHEYYSANKKNKHEAFVGRWRHLENLMLSEVNQTHEHAHCVVSLI